jgi:hypothetical protein
MLTSHRSSLKALHAELLRNAEVISTFLEVINIRFKYQDTFPFAEDNKGNTGAHFMLPFPYCLSVDEQVFLEAMNTVSFGHCA